MGEAARTLITALEQLHHHMYCTRSFFSVIKGSVHSHCDNTHSQSEDLAGGCSSDSHWLGLAEMPHHCHRVGIKSSIAFFYNYITREKLSCFMELVRCQIAPSVMARQSDQTMNMRSKYLEVKQE